MSDLRQARMIALGPGPFFVLTVWVTMLGARSADAAQLAQACDMSTPTVRKHINKLRLLGYALPAGNRWQLTANVYQLEMFAAGAPGEVVPVIDAVCANAVEPVDNSAGTVDKTIVDEPEEKKFFSLNTTTINDDKLIDDSVIVVVPPDEKFFPGGGDGDECGDLDDELGDDELGAALRDAGVRGPVFDELARHPYLSAAHVRGHEAELRARKKQRYGVGLLVTVLRGVREGDAAPRAPGDGARYAEWAQ